MAIREEVGLLEERRMKVAFTSAIVKKTTTSRYNCHIRPTKLHIRELVFQSVDIGGKNSLDGKL